MKKVKTMILVGATTLALAGAASQLVSADSISRIQAASISVIDAKAIALKTAPSGKIVSVDLDGNKTGSVYYEITVLDGGTEKEYKIDATTGAILKSKEEAIDDAEDTHLAQYNPKLSFEDAEKILQQKYPQAKIYDEELDLKNGQVVYKLEALQGNQKVKLTLHADTGAILSEKVK